MEIYLVGGAVRDQLLDYPVYDKDWVVVGSSPDEMISLGYKPVGNDFPVFIHPETGEEYALARTERKSGKGYTGFQYHASPDVTLEEDLSRRDLTINAMAQSSNGHIVDPFDGQKDLEARILRHVSSAFSEDPLRVLRVARFAARYAHLGFSVAPETLALMQQIAATDELAHLTRERIWAETERAIGEQSPLTFFRLLNQADATQTLFPELLPLGKLNEAKQLETHFTPDTTTTVRFAALVYLCFATIDNPAEQLTHFCQGLRCPNGFRDLSLQVLHSTDKLLNWAHTSADERLNVYLKSDLLRRPERLSPLLEACSLLAQTFKNKTLDTQFYVNLQTELKTIQPADIIQAGFKGAAIGEEIKRRQLALCTT
ncbi:hypothetical protein [Neptunomonas concharum]|uniref:CCA-adding enzyme n=1 Tax=Neptunomonas concharum TaxID=1031538 RepID=A0A5P1R9C2_9GAMM|nr:hypothetical protein [Neptunomonas concharum]QEQ95892.1 hypothetical protein F0U83_03770 [Neptunomonas concharum]